MYKTFIILLLSLFINTFAKAQSIVPSIVIGRDTLPHVTLDEVNVFAKRINARKYARQQKRNHRLAHNVRKALPYAKIAAAKINEIEALLAQAHSKREKERIIKEEYKQLMKTFKKPLMSLTVTQGKILVRLIYRETNNSSFHHIKEYKGSVNAYFWQSLALLFGNNLKADYEPEGRDKEIEEVVRQIEKGL
ncbi:MULTISPECIES: DUF4294 domain-containing protein [Butyricimonas]|uniref:DUF4294 domain-containing protein n=1 Tax=Butyricimonas TaxID=574697 RepID=UPI001D06AA47|nr:MULTISPECIES: DUF4294 domain-containing protein [Butyricimonas]MCB6970802.1 DUF4294 domain-containing protein [Butyricimonas synergistica]MCG4517516.1 DUF4294 domain-containing protein [Butyricimonas sp. DFI.6.44]